MATRSMNPLTRLVRNVRRAALLREPIGVADGRLLDAFLGSRDETAFELLVKRHGPMVLGVCMRVIGNLHDAEDAFQAVFLVLARKAASIVPRDLVGNWLHGVAYRTALQARDRLGRHRARERQVTEMPQPTVEPEVDLKELHRLLDLELDRLPEKFRVPIVLCDLEGQSRKDVAVQLKIPEGTLSSRLAKGRDLLAGRLGRHGLALSSAAVASMLGQHVTAGMLQPALVASIVKAAALTAAGQSAMGVVSAEAVALSQGVLKTMFLNKLKLIGVLVLGIMLGGAGVFGLPGGANSTAVRAAPLETLGVQSKVGTDDPEPLDGSLLRSKQIQKELRLSKNQINRLQSLANNVDARNSPKREEIAQIQKQIDELHKRINSLQEGIDADRKQSLGKAAPDILSSEGVNRLRQIQRQQRSLDQLLEDPKVRRMLNVDDEQSKKIETILKTEPRFTAESYELFFANKLLIRDKAVDPGFAFWDTRSGLLSLYGQALTGHADSTTNETTLRKLFDVLTPRQQKTLLEWVGEPYQANSWKALRGK
jgi:RNA polymerase sigma factor (sigma-70 family)